MTDTTRGGADALPDQPAAVGDARAQSAQPVAADRAEPYAWYVLAIMVVVYILNFVDRQILSILANDIKADLGLTDADLGFLYGTAFAVFYALFGIPLGRLADSWHRVRLMAGGLALWSAMTALSGFARDGAMLTVARIGVGVGEATASPAAYSLISDWFPKRMRATALAIYSSGLYLGGGVSLVIGALVVERWNAAYPVGGPLGLVGWQAAFLVVGLPGIALAVLVATLREPVRGAIDGIVSPVEQAPFRGFVNELLAVIPPFTLIGAARRGGGALMRNLVAAAVVAAAAYALYMVTGNGQQWLFYGIGVYAVISWATSLRARDPATFRLIWGTPAFLATILGYGTVAFMASAASYWSAPYAERVFDVPKTELAWWIGAPGALAGFLGVIIGGRMADALRQRMPAGRIAVIGFGLVTPIIPTIIAFTTGSITLFYIMVFMAQILTATALGAAAATTQDLVLPRMRGTATATFFLSTTLIGLALGPFLAGQVSTVTGSLGTGMLATLVVVPLGLAALALAWSRVPDAERTLVERARAAGEPI